jgi:hypothetical protein
LKLFIFVLNFEWKKMTESEKHANEQDIEEKIFNQVRRESRVAIEKIEIKPQRRSMSVQIINNPDNEVEHESIIEKLKKKRESVLTGMPSNVKNILNQFTQEKAPKIDQGNNHKNKEEEEEEESSVVEKEIFETIRRTSLFVHSNENIKSTVHEESED